MSAVHQSKNTNIKHRPLMRNPPISKNTVLQYSKYLSSRAALIQIKKKYIYESKKGDYPGCSYLIPSEETVTSYLFFEKKKSSNVLCKKDGFK